ncbi:Transcriptional regulator, LacI family [Acidisarcina polymorpha]|uniref:Transcriptional regulator, LacI family n=1 Tax=Acidisarcina polymorpha TaxID=2211140 RepID=A0A2Z5FZ61_9BACT|nr:LacI family DNA-binding transcriptional regulator [Acidisarcina polymorpha]AXC11695.1 Transcriptional regulator, LacI family [Acidisarcina polymorpha]
MKRERHPTLFDVARHAGVGTTTVSRVINGGSRVSPKTLEQVRRAIDELGFVPNLAARVLKGEQSKTIGLIVPSIADSFFASCAEAIQKVARSFGSLVVVTVTHNDPALEMENIQTLFRRADGLLIAPSDSNNPKLIGRLTRLSIPVVCFDRPLHDERIPAVLTDNYHSAKTATRHLLQHGYKRILCLGGEAAFHTMEERVRGYEAAMRDANRPTTIDISAHDPSSEEIAAMLARHLTGKAPPRAVFCLKNATTIHTYDALQRFGMHIPQQVALVGYDDFLLAATLRPSITVIQQPVEEIGRKAAKLLFERLAAKADHSSLLRAESHAKNVRLKSRLIVRASCGCREFNVDGLPVSQKLQGGALAATTEM